MVLLNECLALRGTESSVREHALLLDDVIPSAGRAGSDEAVSECLARLLDARGHGDDVHRPLLVDLRRVEDEIDLQVLSVREIL